MKTLAPREEASYRAHLAEFARGVTATDASGKRHAFAEADLEEAAMAGRFFGFSRGDYNSSVYAALVNAGRRRFRPALTRAQIIELVATTLRVTVAQVEHSLDFTANYLAMHDGTSPEENHPYPASEP